MFKTRCVVTLVCLILFGSATSAQAKEKWVVTWKGASIDPEMDARALANTPSPQQTAQRMAELMSRVVKTQVKAVPWEQAQADTVFVITETKHVHQQTVAPLEGKARDAFLIKYPHEMDGRKVCLLLSRDNKAYALPMYYFLRRFMDVEWVGPGKLGEVIPENPAWTIPESIDVLENPDYEHRSLHIFADMDAQAWFLNGNRMGFHHSMNKIYDPRKYADQEEFYPYYDGMRHVADPNIKKGRAGWQPCLSHPKAVEMAVEFGLNDLKENPDKRTFGCSVNDGLGYCLCENCLAMDAKDAWNHGNPWLTDRYIRFYNEVLQKMLRKNPDTRIAFLGYNRVKTPPVEVKGDPRLIVFNCVDNTNPIENMVERQKMWAAANITPSLYLRLNDVGFMTVRHYPHALRDLLKVTHDLGGQGFYTETVQNWAACGPRIYLLAQALWDVNLDVDAVLDRYMRLAFGAEAAPAMRAYFDRWENLWERGGSNARYNTMRSNKDFTQMESLTRADIEVFDKAIAQAKRANATPQEKERLKYVATYYRWLRLNADQWLLSEEFKDAAWVTSHTTEEIIAAAKRGLAITSEFDEMTDKVILSDQTAWYWTSRARGQERAVYEDFNGKARHGVVAVYKSSIDDAFGHLTSRLLKEEPKQNVIAHWNCAGGEASGDCSLCADTGSLASAGSGKNLIANGGFEVGQENPLRVDRWGLGGLRWQGMAPVFAWESGSGRNGGRALAAGIGRMEMIGTKPAIEKGKRYRFSFWYKTTDDVNSAVRLFIQGLPPWCTPVSVGPAAGQWRHWSMTFTGNDLFREKHNDSEETALVARVTAMESTLVKRKNTLAKEMAKGDRADKERVAKMQANIEKTKKQLDQHKAMMKREKPTSEKTRMDLQFQVMTLDKDQWMWIDDVELVTILD